MKPGYLTTEFWATLATLAVSAASDFGAGPTLTGQIHDILAAAGPAVVAVYAVVRSVLKARTGSVATRGAPPAADETPPAASGAVLVAGGMS